MKGAIVFLVVFAAFLLLTIGYPDLPPGGMIVEAIFPDAINLLSDYVFAGIDAFTLISAILNGVIYGIIAWVVYSMLNMVLKKGKQPKPSQQTTSVSVDEKKEVGSQETTKPTGEKEETKTQEKTKSSSEKKK